VKSSEGKRSVGRSAGRQNFFDDADGTFSRPAVLIADSQGAPANFAPSRFVGQELAQD
jgi:hypothetical protein